MHRRALVLLFILAVPARAQDAKALLQRAVQSMGGAERLGAVTSLTIQGTGHLRALDQTERTDRGVLTFYDSFADTIDLARGRARRQSKMLHHGPDAETVIHASAAGGSTTSGRWGNETWGLRGSSMLEEWIELNPVALVRKIEAGAPVRRGPHELVFDYRGTPTTVTFDPSTGLPSAVRLTRPYAADFYKYWGDVTTEYRFAFWSVFRPGILFPTVVDVIQNGEPQRAMLIETLQFNQPIDDATMIAPEVAEHPEAHAGLEQVAENIHLLPGRWHSTIVVQPDGVVIIEAPESNARSQAVLDAAAKVAPGRPVKALIATGHMPHYLAGVREYVARGIPIYAVADSAAMIRRLTRAPYRVKPDALAHHPREPIVRVVTGRTSVGTGPTRLDLLPILGEYHRLGVLVPAHHLLYASDVYIPSELAARLADGHPVRPEAAMWLSVLKTHPEVRSIYGMHLKPTPLETFFETAGVVRELIE